MTASQRLLNLLRADLKELTSAVESELQLRSALLSMKGQEIAAASQVALQQQEVFAARQTERDRAIIDLVGDVPSCTKEKLVKAAEQGHQPLLAKTLEKLQHGIAQLTQLRQDNIKHAQRGHHLLQQLEMPADPRSAGTYGLRGGKVVRSLAR